MIKIMQGDCRDVLKTLPAGSINCCVTSPPYFGLRDYGHEDQIGLENTPEAFIQNLVEVFREVKRVLRDDGTLWVNVGDSYASSGGKSGKVNNQSSTLQGGKATQASAASVRGKFDYGCKPKDLIGIPWMLAFALRADGWYLRQDIIWHKPNPMPESVTDRCTNSHEYIFLLSKSPKYYYDNEAIKEDAQPDNCVRNRDDTKLNNCPGRSKMGGLKTNKYETRNKRSVWTVAVNSYKGAHFATYPIKLIQPCIRAGCPAGGTVLDPFGGSGTTGVAAASEGRNAVLIELNPEYVHQIEDRSGLFAHREKKEGDE